MTTQFKKFSSIWLFALHFAAVLIFSLAGIAEAVNVKGRATINVKGSLLSSVTDAERIAARKAALLDAWKQYLSDPDVASQARTLLKFSQEIEGNLEAFMTRIEYLEESVNKDKKQYTVFLAAQIMDDKVQAFVKERTGAGQQASMSGSGFAVLFLMRSGTSSKQFDETREQVSEKSATAQTVGDDDGSVTTTTKKRSSSGGSTTQKADDEKFKVIEGADQAAAMIGKVMGPAGFEVSEFRVIAEACERSSVYDEARDAYVREGTVNIAAMAKLTRECGKKLEQPFKYLAVVMAEVGAPIKEKGEQVVIASIRMNVSNIEKPIPVSIANTEFQNKGNGQTTAQAQGVVMSKVGSQVGREIVDKLNEKGLK
jgi:hypothetical protein